MSAPLYTLDILRLAASLSASPRLTDPAATAERRAAVCGSRVIVDIDVDDTGAVSAFGLDVRACALGQASAAVLAAAIVGRRAEDIAAARDTLAAFLAGDADAPGAWPGLAVLAVAQGYPARHASIRLPFEAAAEAALGAAARVSAS